MIAISSNIVISTFAEIIHSVPTDSSTAQYGLLLHKVKVNYSINCPHGTDGD
jgi:hypothetical protein